MTTTKSTGISPLRRLINWLNSESPASLSITARVFTAIAPVLGAAIPVTVVLLVQGR